MNSISRILSLIILLCLCISAQAQKKPSWTNGFFRDLPNSYITVGIGEGRNDMEARENAEQKIKADNKHVIGVSEDTKIRVQMRIVDAYYEPSADGRRVYVLAQVSKFTNFNIAEEVKVTNEYKLYGESFIPGMAQIKKGQTGKGIFFIGAEAACIGTIIAAEAQRSSFTKKIKTTHSAQHKIDYKDKADNWCTIRNVAIAGVAAVYVWNVVDGIMSKGNKRVIVGKSLAMSPWATPDATGLAMRITF